MIRTLFLPVLFLVLLLSPSCDLADLDEPIVVSQVEKEFVVSMWEALSPSGRSFELRVETLKPSDCLNTSIATQSRRIGPSLRLSLLAIAEPESCDPGSRPARAAASYGRLDPGFYELAIDLKETIVNEGSMVVFGDRYELRMNSLKGLELEATTLRRVPDGLIWGYFSSDDAQTSTYAAFLDAIGPYVEPVDLLPGEYGYFSIKEQRKEVVLPEAPETDFLEPFAFRFSGEDTQAFQQVLRDFRAQQAAGSSLLINTWEGRNW